MTDQNNAAQAANKNPLSEEYVNEIIQRHGYDSPESVIAQLHQWIGLHGGEDTVTLLMYEAHKALSKLRAPVADETQALHDHDLWFQEYGQTLGAFYNNLTIHTRAAWVAASRQYAALASAPVAGEAQPVAYLHTSNRMLTWPGKLTEVQLNSGVWRPLYDRPAAPQASEAVRDAALKRACSLREVTCKKCGLQVISSCRGDGCPVKDRYADLRALSAQPGARK